MRKYEFTGEIKTTGVFGHIIVKRIRAIVTFGSVKTGDLGGWIEKVDNLSEEGNAWVYNNAEVYGNARVYNNAEVYDNAKICGDARVYNNAEVHNKAMVYGDAEVYDNAGICNNAKIYGNARVYNNAKIYDNAKIYGDAGVYDNARVCGDAMVYGDAGVYDNARVCGDAKVYGDAMVCGNARVLQASHLLVAGPIGTRNSFTTFFRDRDGEITVKCGCFLGKIEQFLEKVQQTHGESKYAAVYRACVEIAKMQIKAEWMPCNGGTGIRD